jgi:hypothetical protein
MLVPATAEARWLGDGGLASENTRAAYHAVAVSANPCTHSALPTTPGLPGPLPTTVALEVGPFNC